MTICTHCNNLFNPKAGSTGKFCSLNCSSAHNNALRKKHSVEQYKLFPKLCKQCNLPIDYILKNRNNFCSSNCAAHFNNSKKDWDNIKTGPNATKIKSPNLSREEKAKRRKLLPDAVGPHTKIFLNTCKITGITWYGPTIKTIHPSAILTKQLYRYQCRFKFGLTSYPDLFKDSSSIIKEYGWYSAANKGNNLSGCSRDHMFSVSDGFINKIDPSIISHPANCKVIPHRENQCKNKKSTITLEELYNRIDDFNKKHGMPYWN